jgi:tryptophan-rich sensory protein
MKTLKILNIITFVIVVVVNGLASTLPLNGLDTGQISDMIPSLFTPAGYVFSIWGVIYLALLAFSVYQALPAQRDNKRLQNIGPWFLLSNLFNSAWIFAWHYLQYGLSLVIMLGLLTSLLILYTKAGIGVKKAADWKEKLFLDMPFGIYLGWIAVATIANAATVLLMNNWAGFGIAPEIWTIVVLLVGTVLAVAMAFLRKEIAYPLVAVWAFIGIYNARPEVAPVAITALIGAAVAFLGIIASRLPGLKKKA